MKKVNNFFVKKKERKKKRITCEEDRLGAAQRRTNGRDSRSSRREKRKQVKIGNLKCLWIIVAMYSDSLDLETKRLALDVIISNCFCWLLPSWAPCLDLSPFVPVNCAA